MTIAIGVLASDGIVIAADSQVTSAIKLWKGKMTGVVSKSIEGSAEDGSFLFSHMGGCAVAVAGRPFAQALGAARLVIRTFQEQEGRSGDDLRLALEDALLEFYGRYVIPFSGGTEEQQINIQLLVGAWRDNQQNLWYSDHNLLSPVSYHHSIGLGVNQTDPLLARLTRVPTLDLAQTVLLAGLVVHHAKDVNIHCGKSTDMICLKNNSIYPIGRNITGAIDEACDKYGDLMLATTFREIVGALHERDRKQQREFRRVFRRLLERIRNEGLTEPTHTKRSF